MNASRLWSGNSLRLAALLLAVAVPPAATLIWLGVELLERDRTLAVQREAERRQAAAQAIALSLEQSLTAAARLFGSRSLPAGVTRFVLSDARMDAVPPERVMWVTAPRPLPSVPAGTFADAERREYQGEPDRALAAYVELARSEDRALRAGALLRIARVHRRRARWAAALMTYGTLAGMVDVALVGTPADLVARRAIGMALAESGRLDELARHATQLEQDLLSGRWLLDRSAWTLTVHDLEAWLGRPVPVSADRGLFTAVADRLWDDVRTAHDVRQPRRLIMADGAPVTLLTRASDEGIEVLAISPEVLRTWTSASAGGSWRPDRLALITDAGAAIAGTVPIDDEATVTLPASETGLPWTVVAGIPAASPADDLAQRRRLLALGLAAILVLLAGGSYFLWRVVQRELTIVRLQTDFVAAVSHEFRTPLTSLQHVTELLEEDDEMPRDRRRLFYAVFHRNTARLHQLVESLLEFARMEAGRKPYHLRPIDAAAFTEHVVHEFRRHAGADVPRIDLDTGDASGLRLQADVAALTNAVWNLLDNAVKYSPGSEVVHVSVHAHPAGAAIAVRDEGIGIPAHERQTIFSRFVRGRQAIGRGIAGTGLGLAMVAHIVRAHSGCVEIDSQEGAGSTFRIVLPVDGAAMRDTSTGPHDEPARAAVNG